MADEVSQLLEEAEAEVRWALVWLSFPCRRALARLSSSAASFAGLCVAHALSSRSQVRRNPSRRARPSQNDSPSPVKPPKRGLPPRKPRPGAAAPAAPREAAFEYKKGAGKKRAKTSPRASAAPEPAVSAAGAGEGGGEGVERALALLEASGTMGSAALNTTYRRLVRDPTMAVLRAEAGIQEPEPELGQLEARALEEELLKIQQRKAALEEELQTMTQQLKNKPAAPMDWKAVTLLPEHQKIVDDCVDPVSADAYALEIVEHFAVAQDYIRQVEHLHRLQNVTQKVLERCADQTRGDVTTPRSFMKKGYGDASKK